MDGASSIDGHDNSFGNEEETNNDTKLEFDKIISQNLRCLTDGEVGGVNLGGIPIGNINNSSGPTFPTGFHQFQQFPSEIRIAIWNFAAGSNPRLLEVIRVTDPEYRVVEGGSIINGQPETTHSVHNNGHGYYRIKEHFIPSILRVNSESRREGMKIFQLRSLSHLPRMKLDKSARGFSRRRHKTVLTWFRPDIDIIYFGANSCMQSIVKFFLEVGRVDIERVAFAFHVGVEACCTFDTVDYLGANLDDIAIDEGRGIYGGVNILDILHGKPEGKAGNKLLPGVPNVKEVFLVMKSELMNTSQLLKFSQNFGDTTSLTFRPAVHDGHTKCESLATKYFHRVYLQDVMSGDGIFDDDEYENLWADRQPMFRYVSLAPPVKTGTGRVLKHDAVRICQEDVVKLLWDRNYLKRLALETGVEIELEEQKVDKEPEHQEKWRKQYYVKQCSEVCFYNGTKKAIEKAKESIWETIARGDLELRPELYNYF